MQPVVQRSIGWREEACGAPQPGGKRLVEACGAPQPGEQSFEEACGAPRLGQFQSPPHRPTDRAVGRTKPGLPHSVAASRATIRQVRPDFCPPAPSVPDLRRALEVWQWRRTMFSRSSPPQRSAPRQTLVARPAAALRAAAGLAPRLCRGAAQKLLSSPCGIYISPPQEVLPPQAQLGSLAGGVAHHVQRRRFEAADGPARP